MPDFLLELLSEEIPARMQAKASADLARLFGEKLAEAGLKAEAIESYATPRRLSLIARGLPEQTEAVSEEIKGPRASAPPQALEGFLRKTGVARDQLVERGGVLFAVVERPGRDTADVLAEAIPAIVRAFPWPKSMRWGAASLSTESLRWVRPLHGIVALLGERIVNFEVAGVKSGAATVGHRFMHPGAITIGSANDYVEKLRACRVILDPAERRAVIAEGAAARAAEAGLTLVEDDALLAENAGLTEWPVPLLGAFDPEFLDVPPEVIQLTMRTNQKYFVLKIPSGTQLGEARLAPNFICIANIEASDGGAAIAEGNRKVLAARLADARYFWEADLKVPLEQQAEKLRDIVFHERLGTVADKVERVAKLARWLVEEGIVKSSGEELAEFAERAARLCKADLVTGLVGEFPELQGIIGGHLARAQSEPDEIADAVRDHYKPVGQGDEVPTAPVTVAVSLADKLDTLAAFFSIGEKPTGSKDPFGLRRAALSLLALITSNNVRFSARDTAYWAALLRVSAASEIGERVYVEPVSADDVPSTAVRLDVECDPDLVWNELQPFLIDRLKVQQREAGVRHDLIDAVFALGGEDDLVRLLARVKALQGFVETAEGADLLAGYKRAANILKKEGWPPADRHPELGSGSISPPAEGSEEGMLKQVQHDEEGKGEAKKVLSYTPLAEEAALIAALDSAEPRARAAVEAEDFEGAMAALASLRAPVDAFFDKVTVNDPDPGKRAARLDLLMRMRDAVHQVADFSKIEG